MAHQAVSADIIPNSAVSISPKTEGTKTLAARVCLLWFGLAGEIERKLAKCNGSFVGGPAPSALVLNLTRTIDLHRSNHARPVLEDTHAVSRMVYPSNIPR